MSQKVIAFGASNSRNSINKKLATFAANQLSDAEITILDLNDFEMPIYSIDREEENGIPDLAKQFKALIYKQFISQIHKPNMSCIAVHRSPLILLYNSSATIFAASPVKISSCLPGT